MRTLTISRAAWGVGNDGGYLYTQTSGKLCILGHVLHQKGIPLETLNGMCSPGELIEHHNGMPIPGWLLTKDIHGGMVTSDEADAIMKLNDTNDVTNECRELKLQELFLNHGIILEFTD